MKRPILIADELYNASLDAAYDIMVKQILPEIDKKVKLGHTRMDLHKKYDLSTLRIIAIQLGMVIKIEADILRIYWRNT